MVRHRCTSHYDATNHRSDYADCLFFRLQSGNAIVDETTGNSFNIVGDAARIFSLNCLALVIDPRGKGRHRAPLAAVVSVRGRDVAIQIRAERNITGPRAQTIFKCDAAGAGGEIRLGTEMAVEGTMRQSSIDHDFGNTRCVETTFAKMPRGRLQYRPIMFFRFFFGYFQAVFSSAGRGDDLDSTTIATNITDVIISGRDGQRKPICGIEAFTSSLNSLNQLVGFHFYPVFSFS